MRGRFQSTTEAQEYIHDVLEYICDISWFLELVLINLAILGIFTEPWILYTTEYKLSMAKPRLRKFTERTVAIILSGCCGS